MRHAYPPYDFHHPSRELPALRRIAAWLGRTSRWVRNTLAVLLALLAVQAFFVQPFWTPTGSMADTLRPYDHLLAEKITYFFRDPIPGEVVILRDPAHPRERLVKRVIAVAGQSVDIIGGHVYVNGVPLSEPYVRAESFANGTVQMPLVVPDGHVFLMGDNRTQSRDGREFGPQPLRAIQARALLKYWPPRDAGLLLGQHPTPLRSAEGEAQAPRL